ncbi:MAG: histidinol dehydrogenase [Planctomycetota bacterium]|nr:histidinol dehydrogenase [Planctomycetota bacterium]
MQNISIPRIDASSNDFAEALASLRHRLSPSGNIVSERGKALTLKVFGEALLPDQVVQRICEDVRTLGTPALLRYCRELDGSDLQANQLRVSPEQVQEAHAAAAPEFLATVRKIRKNIHDFQSAILHTSVATHPSPGVTLEQRYTPLDRIGICVPGGAAAYPSTLLMTAVPAQAAGVPEIVVVAPPTKLGAYNPQVLAICHELGIKEVYAMGGAQAVAAMAYGLPEIRGVDKIVGPGSLFVALAKRHVFGHVDIDSIAGPSEVVVIADETTRPDFAASDILAQAEHSPGASLLISWQRSVQDAIDKALHEQIVALERSELTMNALESFGSYILARDEQHACELTNLIAPEHLHIATREPRKLLAKIRHSGATFLGDYSPVALGDYAAGPSHVLPTGGTARWASGLSSNHFLRSSSVIEYSKEALQSIGEDIERMASCEGLTAHRNSVTIRTQS